MIAHINTDWLSETLAWVLRTTWQAALLAILVRLAQWLLRHRLSARMRCLMWGIVVLRLLMPPLPQTRWTLFQGVPPTVNAMTPITGIIPVAASQPSQNVTAVRESFTIESAADSPLPMPASRTLSRTWPVMFVGGLLHCSGRIRVGRHPPTAGTCEFAGCEGA